MANSLSITGGGMQGTFVSSYFANPVTVLVRNSSNVPQSGVVVSSIVPGSGASCTTAATVTSDSSGIASFSILANATAGQYSVAFSASGANNVATLFRNSNVGSSSQTKTPTLCTQEVVTGGYTLPWSNPGFIISTGTSNYAQMVFPSINTSGAQMLRGSQMGFTIPAGSLYVGAEFNLYGSRVSGTNYPIPSCVLFAGTYDPAIGTGKLSFRGDTAWRGALTVGGPTANWGQFSSDPIADINDPTFSVGVFVDATTSVTMRVNQWSLKIYYSDPAPPPTLSLASPLLFCAN